MEIVAKLFIGIFLAFMIEAKSIIEQGKNELTQDNKQSNVSVSDFMKQLYGTFLKNKPNFTAKQLTTLNRMAYDDIKRYKEAFDLHKKLDEQIQTMIDLAMENSELQTITRVITKGTLDHVAETNFDEDCNDIHEKTTGLHYINPKILVPFRVMCDMKTDGGSWTVIQQRKDGNVNFQRTWQKYRDGFGNLDGEFWLGNEKIHKLTSNGNYELRVDIRDWEGASWFALYKTFIVGDEVTQYKLTIGNYTGTAGDSLSYNNKMMFSARDRDNDESSGDCSNSYGGGGWWYKSCVISNLNGLHTKGSGYKGVYWHHAKNSHYSMKFSRMMIRRI